MSYRPLRPELNSFALRLYTLQDAIDQVLLSFDLDSAGTHGRLARSSVFEAYRTFPSLHGWKWFERRGLIITEAPYSTGTIEYDASTRLVTLTDGTWPSDARFRQLLISSNLYRVAKRTSDSVLELAESACPLSDLAAGTSYELHKGVYPLPHDYRKGGRFQDLNQSLSLVRATPQQMLSFQTFNYSANDTSSLYVIRQSDDYMAGLVVELIPPPLTEREYQFYYTASPRPFTLFSGAAEYTTGSISSSGTTVTGSDTTFTDAMVGCVLRSSANASLPTGIDGRKSLDNPYDEQRVIQSVASGTSLTVDQAFTSSLSGAKFSIGSPLDMEAESMLSAFNRQCDSIFAAKTMRSDANEYYARFIRELKAAMAADQRASTLEPEEYPYPESLSDIAIIV